MAFVLKQLSTGAGFGHDLKELRELRGMSHDDLARVTKIHSSVIAAFEEERLGDIQDPVYAERHVRSIVAALEGRPGYFVKKYRELVEAHGTSQQAPLIRKRPKPSDFFVLSRAVAFLGFLAVVLVTGGYLVWQGLLLQEPPVLSVSEPHDGAILATPTVVIKGETDPTALVTVNGQAAVVDRDGAFSLSFDLPRGSTTLTIEARRRYGSAVQEIRRVTYERAAIPEELPEPQAPTSTLPENTTSTAATSTLPTSSSTQE